MVAGRPLQGAGGSRPAFARDTQRVRNSAARRILHRHAALARETVIGPAFAGRGALSSPTASRSAFHSAACGVGYIPAARGGGRQAAGRSVCLPGAGRPFFGSIFPMTYRGANAPVLFQSRKQSLHDFAQRFQSNITHILTSSSPINVKAEGSKVSEKHIENSPISRREKPMSACAEAYSLVREIAGMPVTPVGDAIQRVVSRLTPHIHMSVSRAKNLWYGEARLIRAEEIDALRLAAAEQRRKLEAGRAQVRHIAELYRAAAERLRALDPAFHGFEITRLEQQADQICPLDRPGTAGASPVGNAASDGDGK